MDLHLDAVELDLLRDILSTHLSRLSHEIARTDSRTARKELKKGEAILEGIIDRLEGRIRKAS